MLNVHASASEFHGFAAIPIQRREVEFLGTVISEVFFGAVTGLKPVGANNDPRGEFLDDEMVAYGVKWVRVQTRRERLGKAFIQLEVKDAESKTLRGLDLRRRGGETDGILESGFTPGEDAIPDGVGERFYHGLVIGLFCWFQSVLFGSDCANMTTVRRSQASLFGEESVGGRESP